MVQNDGAYWLVSYLIHKSIGEKRWRSPTWLRDQNKVDEM